MAGKKFHGRTSGREVHSNRKCRKCKVKIDTPFLTSCFLAFVGLRQNHSFVLNITLFSNQFLRRCLKILVTIFLMQYCYQQSTGWNCATLIWGKGLSQRQSHVQFSTSSLLVLCHRFLTSETIWKDSRNSNMLPVSFVQHSAACGSACRAPGPAEVFSQEIGSDLAVFFSLSGNKIKPEN